MNKVTMHINDKAIEVGMVSKPETKTFYTTLAGAPVTAKRIIKNTVETDFETLLQDYNPQELSQLLINYDCEIDRNLIGKTIQDHRRVWLNDFDEPAHNVLFEKHTFDKDGKRVNVDPYEPGTSEPTTKDIFCLQYMDIKSTCFKFVFSSSLHVVHLDNNGAELLYNCAKELRDNNKCLFAHGGEKTPIPLTLTRSAKQYYGVLIGDYWNSDKPCYNLTLKLSNTLLPE